MITHPDFYTWNTENLYRRIERIIHAKSARREPYYILVVIKKGYLGPSMKSDYQVIMDFEGKTVISTRIILTDTQPAKMIGTKCWRIDNRIGEAKCLWILPRNIPILTEMDMDDESAFVAKSAQGMPIIWNEN